MRGKKQSSKKQLGMYFLIIPIVVACLFVFGISKAYQASEPLEILLQEQLQQNGDILNQDSISTKTNGAQIILKGVESSSTSPFKEALYIIDGVAQERKLEKRDLTITPDMIEFISVHKGQEAISAYGKKGENGVIIINTKGKAKAINGEKGTSKESEVFSGKDKAVSREVHGYSNEGLGVRSEKDTGIVVQGYRSIPKSNGEEHGFSASNIDASLRESKSILGFNIRSSDKSKDQPLILIGGKEVGSMLKINPDLIESVSIFKDKDAIAKYGEKGKNGVIEIELKKDTPL
jgi:hypothetical protein